MNSPHYSWLHYTGGNADIKVEAPADFCLLSPPTSPFNSPSITNPTLPNSLRRRSTSLASPKRPRPYPLPHRSRIEGVEKMPSPPAYAWRNRSTERRSSDADHNPIISSDYNASLQQYQSDQRSSSSSSSSLTNAMGDPTTRYSSPQPRSEQLYNNMGMSMPWMPTTPAQPMSMYTPGVAGDNVQYYPDASVGGTYNQQGSLSPPELMTTDTTYMNNASEPFPSPSSSSVNTQEEIRRLRRKVEQLEQQLVASRAHIRVLEESKNGTPSPSAAFQASWKARTEARIRKYCSLNRAGNALCSWHDSRRERRIHPPRMAPQGYLNCGCTFEEALFEESLSRHGVGSYLPGETVRMDPALRNPLLKLLQQRYGYRDGDFERDSLTGDWVHGEGPAMWQAQIAGGVTNPRRPPRPDHR